MSAGRRAPAIVAVLLLTASVATAAAAWAALGNERRDGARATTTAHAAYLDRRLHEVAAVAGALTASNRERIASRVPALQDQGAVGLLLADGDRVVAEPLPFGLLDPGDTLGDDGLLGPLVSRAVDRGTQVAGPVSIDGRPAAVAVGPRFAGPGPAGAGERRALAAGYVVVAYRLDLGGTGTTVRLTGPDGRTSVDRHKGARGELARAQIDVGGRVWQVRYSEPPPPSRALPFTILVLGTLAAAMVLVAGTGLERRRNDALAQAALRERQLAMIERAGAQLQQSLDLGELLPAVAVTLADDFGFGLVDIALADDDGHLSGAFRLGMPIPVPDAPEAGAVPAGRRLVLRLRRGYRTVGALTLRTERPLDPVELTALHALADLLAVAVTNAQLLQREREAGARLRELDALKNAFLGTVSHELRTSITAITGFTDMLANHWERFDDEKRRELAGRVRRNAGNLKHLVDDLLDFARLEQRRVPVAPRPVELGELVRQLTDSMAHLTGDRHLEVSADGPVPAWVDPFAVERILANLLSNAGKYSPDGSTVRVSVASVGDQARLIVDDEGAGVPADERSRIFTRFYRRDDDVTLSTKGVGIGLAILADFTESSGGTVRVDDAPSGGARFTVDLPSFDPSAAPEPVATLEGSS